VIDRALLVRAWGVLGAVSAVLTLAGFLFVLLRAGGHPGDATGAGAPLHEAWLRATTTSFAGIVACQVGTAFASRVEHGSSRAHVPADRVGRRRAAPPAPLSELPARGAVRIRTPPRAWARRTTERREGRASPAAGRLGSPSRGSA
jgi:hypothetical protein